MADDLTLAIVLKTILDSKGFEEAQDALKKFAGAANGAGDKTKGWTKELGGSRGAVADMTRVLLMNIGVTGAAGETAKAAGLAMTSLGSAVSPVTLVATGLVAAAALLIPKLVEWAKSSKDTEQATKELKDGLIALLPELEDYVAQVPNATAELKALFEVSRGEALRKQKQEIADLTEAINANEKEVAKLVSSTREIVIENRRSGASHTVVKEATAENKAKAAELNLTIDEQRAKLNALLAAQEDQVTLSGQIRGQLEDERERRRKLAESTKKQADEQERLNKLREDDLQLSFRLRTEAAKEENKKKKEHKEDIDRATERVLAIEKEKGGHLETARAAVQARRLQTEADTLAYAQAGAAMLSFFGKQKNAAIAQALIDTYAAAAAAIRPPNPPLPWSAPFLALALATGFAQVANIRRQNFGFDDPFNDLLAEKMGRKSAADFVRHFGAGFQGGLASAAAGPIVNNHHIVNNSGMSVGEYHSHSIVGSKRTQQLVDLNRELKQIDRRIERRTRIGG